MPEGVSRAEGENIYLQESMKIHIAFDLYLVAAEGSSMKLRQVTRLYKTVKYKKALKSYKKILKIDKGVDNAGALRVYSACHRDWEKL